MDNLTKLAIEDLAKDLVEVGAAKNKADAIEKIGNALMNREVRQVVIEYAK